MDILSCSLDKLCEIIDPNMYKKGDNIPLFEIRADIEEKQIMFDPEFDFLPESNGLCDLVNEWISTFFKVCTQVARVDSMKGPPGDYLAEVSENFKVRQMLSKVSLYMSQTKAKCEDFKNGFNE